MAIALAVLILAAVPAVFLGCDGAAERSSLPDGWNVEPVTGDDYEYGLPHPADWRIIRHAELPNVIGLVSPTNPASLGLDALPEIRIKIVENPSALPVRDLYLAISDPSFEEARGGVEDIVVQQRAGFALHGIIGPIATEVVTVSDRDMVVEFELTDLAYRWLFYELVHHFRFTPGDR